MTAYRALLLAMLPLALLAACSSSSSPSAGGAGPSTNAATPLTMTTTTAVATTTTTAAAASGPTVYFPTRDAADDHFILAWQNHDAKTALQGATPAAVADIFTQNPDGYSLYGCDEAQFTTSNCNWRNRGTNGYAHVTLTKAAAGWYVSAVYVSTDG